MSDGPKYGSEPGIHGSTSETRERAYDRCRRTGIGADASKKLAEQAVRESHDKLNRRG